MEENKKILLKSSIKKIKEPDFSKEVIISKLYASKDIVDWHFKHMKESLGNKINDQEIWKKINSIVLHDNVFNESMKVLVGCYDINVDFDELNKVANFVKKSNKNLEKASPAYINTIAKRMIEKQLIFEELAKEWKIEVSDDEVKKFLHNYYKTTNKPIRDIVNSKQALNNIKFTILNQKVTSRICSCLKWKADWDAIRKSAIENQQKTNNQEQKS